MEKLRDWFGTPVRAGSTLIWLCWVSFLVSIFGFLAFLLFLAARSVLT